MDFPFIKIAKRFSSSAKAQTKKEDIQAFVAHVFIYQEFFMFFQAESHQSDEVPVLWSGNQDDFVLQLDESLA